MPKLVALVLGIMLAISLVTATQFGPAGPEGKYYDKTIATEGLTYYEFKDGNVTMVAPLGAKLSISVTSIPVGTYAKREDKWIWTTAGGSEATLRAGLFAIEIDGITSNGVARFPRYWFPH